MKSEPLSPKSFLRRCSGRGLLLFSLPLIFFFASSGAVLFLTTYLLGHPISPAEILGIGANYSVFSTKPPASAILGESYVSKRARPELLRDFLESYRSPLAPYAEYIIEISENYNLDWRLLTGIAGNESLFGRVIPYNSYNAWGWGVHSKGTLRFGSWEEGIETVAKGLKENYIDKGLTTIDLIATRYAPVSIQNDYPWADNVRFFMERLEQGKGYRE
jgi:hypothetical protein